MRNLLILLGKKVHDPRAAKSWSQEEFAHVSGLHRTYIGQIERGEKNISFGNLSEVSSVLGVAMSELLLGLEAGDTLVAAPRGPKGGGQEMKIQKLVRQIRVQQPAAERAIASLEQVVGTPAAKRAETRLKHGARKSK